MNKLTTIILFFVAIVLVAIYRNKLILLFAKPVAKPRKPVTVPEAGLDINKLLKRGATGAEVKLLQQWLGVDDDGDFGTVTESALLERKGVMQVTLSDFGQLPDVITDEMAAFLGFDMTDGSGDWSSGTTPLGKINSLNV